ncbi:MAG: hypothetical protein K6C06_03110 [Lachnospiraceae bacterium]|nr:hypothetical protein [Lachnospiraceae bacterium]
MKKYIIIIVAALIFLEAAAVFTYWDQLAEAAGQSVRGIGSSLITLGVYIAVLFLLLRSTL